MPAPFYVKENQLSRRIIQEDLICCASASGFYVKGGGRGAKTRRYVSSGHIVQAVFLMIKIVIR